MFSTRTWTLKRATFHKFLWKELTESDVAPVPVRSAMLSGARRTRHFPLIPSIEIYGKWLVRESIGRKHATFAWDHVLCKFEVFMARNVLKTVRAQAKKCLSYEWSHPKWLLEVETWVRGSPLCMFTKNVTASLSSTAWAENPCLSRKRTALRFSKSLLLWDLSCIILSRLSSRRENFWAYRTTKLSD
jgi:hypothetical protein